MLADVVSADMAAKSKWVDDMDDYDFSSAPAFTDSLELEKTTTPLLQREMEHRAQAAAAAPTPTRTSAPVSRASGIM